MRVNFQRLTWENYPSTETPINADNLNRLEEGVAGLYSDMAGIEEGIDSFKDETSAQVESMQDRLTTMEGDIDSFEEITLGQVGSMQTRVTSMENGLPTMVGNQIDDKFGDDIGDNVTSWLTEHVTPSGSAVVVDDTLSIAGAAADAKKTGDELSSLKEELQNAGLSNEAKIALLACFQNVAWINDDGQAYYDALSLAINPPAELSYITCIYTQSRTVYSNESLGSLRNDLVVIAHYGDGTTETISVYTLSGTLTVGTSIITVSYGGKTTTFTVIVTQYVEQPTWESGTYSSAMTPTSNSARIRTPNVIDENASIITPPEGCGIILCCLDSEGQWYVEGNQGKAYWDIANSTFTKDGVYVYDSIDLATIKSLVGQYHYFKIIARNEAGTSITPSYGDEIVFT